MKQQGRGASASVTRGDGKVCVVRWFDHKPISMLSAVHAEQPEDTCQRWSKKDKQYVTVTRPSIVSEYDSKMGGADLVDRMMSYYQKSVRTKKWTIRMLMHFTDLSFANSWLLYRQDNSERHTPRKDVMQFLEFRIDSCPGILDQVRHWCRTCKGRECTPFATRQKTSVHSSTPCLSPHNLCCTSSRDGQLEKPSALQSKRLLWEVSCAVYDMYCVPMLADWTQLFCSVSHRLKVWQTTDKKDSEQYLEYGARNSFSCHS